MSGANEVWVTGIGVVSAAGHGVEALRSLIHRSASAVEPQATLGGRRAGVAPVPPAAGSTRRLDRSARLFAAACEDAWSDAGLAGATLRLDRCGVIEGSSLGPMAGLLAEHRAGSGRGPAHASHLVRFMNGAGGAAFAQRHGLSGPVFALSAGSVSAAFAMAEAWVKLAFDLLDVVVVGGGETPLDPEVVACFDAAGVLSPADAVPPCRPFDSDRSGTVLGEGAGAIVMERAGHARRRGAAPRAIVTGVGASCESHSAVAPDPSGVGVAQAIRASLAETDLSEIGWIKAHGTGTRANDAAECRGLATALSVSLEQSWLTSLKPAIGHCLGASAAVETVAAVLALEDGLVPATIGTSRIDPALPRCAVATTLREDPRPVVLLLAESFGGRCAATVLRRPGGLGPRGRAGPSP
jgi:3-oxoacyl-[acyl-carrier-protein] synthase II